MQVAGESDIANPSVSKGRAFILIQREQQVVPLQLLQVGSLLLDEGDATKKIAIRYGNGLSGRSKSGDVPRGLSRKGLSCNLFS
jgi:hypothetical protein